MKHPNYNNEVLKNPPGKLEEVPGFAGYFVGPSNEIYSCWGWAKRILKPSGRNGEGRDDTTCPFKGHRVSLKRDDGQQVRMLVRDVVRMAIGEEELKYRLRRQANKGEEHYAADLGDLF